MKAAEVIGGGLWAASAVAVAGYTWQALTGTYEQFPSVTSSGQQNAASKAANETAATQAAAQTGPFGWLNWFGFQWGKSLGKSLGINNFFPNQNVNPNLQRPHPTKGHRGHPIAR